MSRLILTDRLPTQAWLRRRFLPILCLLILGLAQNGTAAAEINAAPVPVLPGIIIDSIEIATENVFDFSVPDYDNFLFRLANNLHVVTREAVIRREVLLQKGDLYDTALVNESLRNLRSLPYLLKTNISLKKGAHGENILFVNTSDKWTTVAGISYHRSGGRNDFQFSAEEKNFLGRGMTMTHDYFAKDEDRNFYQMELADSRLLGRNFSGAFFYSDNPQAGQVTARIGRPFYNLSQTWGGEIDYTHLRRRLDYYSSEGLAAQDKCRKNKLTVNYSYRFGPKHVKYHFTPEYSYTSLRTISYNLYDPAIVDSLPPPSEDSIVHTIQFTVRLQQIHYVVFDRLNRFHKYEDINLGLDVRATAGRSYTGGFNSVWYTYLAFWPQYTLAVGSNLLSGGVLHEDWYTTDGMRYRRRLYGYFKGYARYHPNQTMVVGIRYFSDRLKNPSSKIYLDEDNGLRGYSVYSASGEDRLIINLENRYFSDVEILSVGVGAVVFADIGNIGTRDNHISLGDFKTAVGAGLRFGVSRSTKGEVVRIDLAYAVETRRWQFSVGTGQFF